MAPALLLVPLTFLTIIGLSNFYSLNLYFAAIFQSINIPVALLSRSTFTVTPLCISTFSIPISIYTSLSILNVLLTSLTVPSAHTSLCCAFSFVRHTTSSFFLFCFEHLYHSASSNFLSLLFSLCISFFLHYLHPI